MSAILPNLQGMGVGSYERRGRNRAEGALRPNKLCAGRAGLAVIFEICLGRLRSMVRCVLEVSVG
jgi:hypothetical protein